ncbi:MAG: T9SS type A sorting domain-containing protein [Bacteroidales bacterium]
MKKFYLFMMMIAISGYVVGQQKVVKEMGNELNGKVIKEMNFDSKTPTDTLVPYGIANGTLLLAPSNGGYIAGTNDYGDFAKAQQFPVSNGYNLEGFLIYVGAKEIVSGADDVTGIVYAMDGSGTSTAGTVAGPGTVLDQVTLNMDTDVDTTGLTPVVLNAPIPMWNDYALALDFANIDDTLGIIHSDDQDPQANTEFAWEQWSDGAWHTMMEAWGFQIDLAFFPVIDNSTTDINEHDFVNGIRMETYPNPAVDVVNLDYQIQSAANVTVQVLDMSGKIVKTEELGQKEAGQYKATFSVNNLDAGMYFYMLEADGKRLAKRMMIK